jgi:hypothetical protein
MSEYITRTRLFTGSAKKPKRSRCQEVGRRKVGNLQKDSNYDNLVVI